jgi:hypothetical protein
MNRSNLTKLFFLTAFFSFAALGIQAQLHIENLDLVHLLKDSKTIVFMPAADTAKHHEYRELLEKHWNFTELEFHSYKQYLNNKEEKGYSFLLFGDDHIKSELSESNYLYWELWTWYAPNGDWNQKKKVLFARLEFYPDPETTFNPSSIYDYRFDTEGHIMNWTPGMFKNYVQELQDLISNKEERSINKFYVEPEDLAKLKNETLYIPDYALDQYNANLVSQGKMSASELMADYPYKYKVVDNDALSDLILNTDKPLYYLLFVRSNSDKYVSIVEGHTGEILYTRFTPLSFSVKRPDIKKLVKTIEKGY